jgi:hypothetical protein
MRMISICALAAAVIAIGVSPAVSASTQPAPAILNLIQKQIGTWKLNLDESRDESGQPYKHGFKVIIRSGYPIQDYTYIGEAGDGEKPYVFSFKAAPDGKVRPNEAGGGSYSMELLPNGIVDAKLWSPNGVLENKFCIPYASMQKIICLATLTTKDGKRTMFTNILDKVSDSTAE